ncbi:MAG: immunity 26/phosphotriesterase HocA family protein [Prevotellaceae bacterium]|jgi:hypothetical protein|nr:immunity 26/phosphotriesterase HocA family protein [Prevotellaceae bacterium]
MVELLFELTNEQRKYLGLTPVEEHWELVKLNDMYLYFDGNTIRKEIGVSNNRYYEQELCEQTAENRTVLLPKTAKGKPKKLNFTATQSFGSFGVYFCFSKDSLRIASYTTQTTYFHEDFDNEKNIDDLKAWLEQWITDSTDKDLQEIEAFKTAKRQHCKFEEGDFFTFKIGRRQWAFGRILIDVSQRQKTEEFKRQKNYGLTNLMGKALIVKVYHKISDTMNIDLDELAKCMTLPSQAIMDNGFYYGEKKIIGHKKLTVDDYGDMLISYSRSISHNDKNTVYLQYGFIYREIDISRFGKYLKIENKNLYSGYKDNPYRNEGIGFGLHIDSLQQCIEAKSNLPLWNSGSYYMYERDLRNPKNIEIKREIFHAFGLDADKSYEENLKIISVQGRS